MHMKGETVGLVVFFILGALVTWLILFKLTGVMHYGSRTPTPDPSPGIGISQMIGA